MPGFYSLIGQNVGVGRTLAATADGRRKGEPISENQSPANGTDLAGITAMLGSVAKLPLSRAPSGCLNVRFCHKPPAAQMTAVLDAFFAMGGSFLAFTMVDRDTLLDAQANPDQHRSLYVRVHGFSEYFTGLPADEQQQIIDRTAH